MIVTERLTLVPHTVELLRAEIHDHQALARMLSATVPENWPPESTVDALPIFLSFVESAPDQVGWFGWYAVTTRTDQTNPILIGGGGFMGPPVEGLVQMGYSVIEQHNRKGYATEMVGGLVSWAFAHPECTVVSAETEWANPYSVRVLEKNGFIRVGPGSVADGSKYERSVSTLLRRA